MAQLSVVAMERPVAVNRRAFVVAAEERITEFSASLLRGCYVTLEQDLRITSKNLFEDVGSQRSEPGCHAGELRHELSCCIAGMHNEACDLWQRHCARAQVVSGEELRISLVSPAHKA